MCLGSSVVLRLEIAAWTISRPQPLPVLEFNSSLFSPLAICGVKSTSGAATLGSPFDGPTLMKSWNVTQSEDHRISISVLYSGFGIFILSQM